MGWALLSLLSPLSSHLSSLLSPLLSSALCSPPLLFSPDSPRGLHKCRARLPTGLSRSGTLAVQYLRVVQKVQTQRVHGPTNWSGPQRKTKKGFVYSSHVSRKVTLEQASRPGEIETVLSDKQMTHIPINTGSIVWRVSEILGCRERHMCIIRRRVRHFWVTSRQPPQQLWI